MKLIYKAINNNGEELRGTREAADRFTLAREMHAEGLTLLFAEPENQAAANKIVRRRWLSSLFGRISTKDLIMFASSLQAMLAAGLPLARSLEIINRQIKNKRFRAIISNLGESISRGESLSKALAKHPDVFPLVFVAMVEAGEESGQLPKAIEVVREQLAKSYDLRRKVKGAMIYPSIIVAVIIIIAVLMMIFLVPTLSSLFKEMKVALPFSTRVVIGLSDFAVNYYPYIALVAALGAWGLWKFLPTPRGKRYLAQLTLHLPAISSISQNLNAAVTMRTLASLVSSGVNMLQAIEITGKVVQNPLYKEVLAKAGPVVEKGGTLSSVFEKEEKLYPILVGEMTAVGEETGSLATMLGKGAAFFEDEVDQATKNLSTIIEPVLMVIIGVAVAFFAVSIISPIYSLTSAL